MSVDGNFGTGLDVDVRLLPTVMFEGVRHVVRARFTIGSEPGVDLRLPPEVASGVHAILTDSDADGLSIEDVGGVGLLVNGVAVREESVRLAGGDRITLGGRHLFVSDGSEGGNPALGLGAGARDTLLIGSDGSCDVALDHPAVSPVHAVIELDGTGAIVRDHSSPPTLLVDGVSTRVACLRPGSELGIGPFRLVFDGDTVIPREQHSLRMDALGVGRVIGDRTILAPATLSLSPGELIAIIGESGAGKTTLLRVLAGIDDPDSGFVLIGGEPLQLHGSDIGYVPQDDLVHTELTVHEALQYAAALRLPEDASDEQLHNAVGDIISELRLTDHALTRVGDLSGGQRKRVSVATELLNRPAFLLLDEPTTGLDPGLEHRSMTLFRHLATGGRTVVLVTHAMRSLDMCDRLVVMGEGGVICFSGPPADALRFFGVDEMAQIYTALASEPASEWNARFEARPDRRRERGRADLELMNAPSNPEPTRHKARFTRQFSILVSRYTRVLGRDRRNLFLLVAQAPVLGLLAGLVYESGALSERDRVRDATNLIFLLVTIAVWLGAISSAREIVRERPLMAREMASGIRLSAYLASKVVVLGALAALQVSALCVVAFTLQRSDAGPGPVLGVFICLLLAAWTAVGMGLCISAFSSTENQATSLIPIALIPQLVLGGAIVAVASMSTVMKVLAGLVFTRWFFAGAGTAYDLNTRTARDHVFSRVSEYGDTFFRVPLGAVVAIAALFSVGFLLIAVVSLTEKEPMKRRMDEPEAT